MVVTPSTSLSRSLTLPRDFTKERKHSQILLLCFYGFSRNAQILQDANLTFFLHSIYNYAIQLCRTTIRTFGHSWSNDVRLRR